jgi:ATP-dependent phosphofructokinase / diphosphate-dependent phosphofructokinase
VDADNRSLPSLVCVLETLGRNVGWIAAATCFANPHLIYFPERPLSLDLIAADVEEVYRREGRAVVVCEGQLDEKGEPFGADLDRQLASNLGHTLAKQLSAKLGIRARAERPGLIGRSCGLFARDRDRREAYACGRAAVGAGIEGESDVMVAVGSGGVTCLTPLNTVAGLERRMPDKFRDYAGPLFGDVPAWEPMFWRVAGLVAGYGYWARAASQDRLKPVLDRRCQALCVNAAFTFLGRV